MVPVSTVELAVGHRVETKDGRAVVTRKAPAEGGGYNLFFMLDSGKPTEGWCSSDTVWQVELASTPLSS